MLFDSQGRQLRCLRISITDRCNLRCIYCMPEEGIALSPPEEILSYEEIERLARLAVPLGLVNIRLTGGEPLVRKDICLLVDRLSRISGLADLSLTTNGVLLEPLARPLRQAGLKRVNVSLDTLDRERFYRLTRGGDIDQTLAGLQAALNAGLKPLKINVVLFADRAGNLPDSDVVAFSEMSRSLPVHIRFIEWMSFHAAPSPDGPRPVPAGWAWKRLAAEGKLEPFPGPEGSGPARYFRYPRARGSIGFITPLSAPFCGECSRLRLTTAGVLKSCLFQNHGIDLRQALRSGASDAEIAALFLQAARTKPPSYLAARIERFSMCQIGG